MDTATSNQAIMRQVVAIFNSGDLSQVNTLFAPTYIDHQKPASIEIDGPEEFATIVRGARASSHDTLHVTIEDLVADEQAVVARLRWRTTDDSGQTLERETIDMLRIQHGKIVAHWGAEEWRRLV